MAVREILSATTHLHSLHDTWEPEKKKRKSLKTLVMTVYNTAVEMEMDDCPLFGIKLFPDWLILIIPSRIRLSRCQKTLNNRLVSVSDGETWDGSGLCSNSGTLILRHISCIDNCISVRQHKPPPSSATCKLLGMGQPCVVIDQLDQYEIVNGLLLVRFRGRAGL